MATNRQKLSKQGRRLFYLGFILLIIIVISRMSEASRREQLYGTLLFTTSTTYRDDFKVLPQDQFYETKYQERPRQEKPPFENVSYLETMTKYRKHVPFNVFHKPKDIVQTNPLVPQEPYTKATLSNKDAIRNRPRLIITPQVSTDDIEDPEIRGIVVRDTYKSTVAAMQNKPTISEPYLSVKSPLPDIPAPANPIYLRKPRPLLVSPEFRMESLDWDGRQLRSYCDVTKEFWLSPTRKSRLSGAK